MYQKFVTAVALTVCSYTDIRYRKVFRNVLLAYVLLVVAGQTADLTTGRTEFLNLAAGLLPGCAAFLISFLTGQGLGYGDSLLIAVIGLSLGIRAGSMLTVTAFLLSGFWAMLLFVRKKSRKTEFPFVPFLLGGFLCQIIIPFFS